MCLAHREGSVVSAPAAAAAAVGVAENEPESS